MDLSSAFHGRDSDGLIELLQIPTPILTNFFNLWDNTSSKFRYSNILVSSSFKNNDELKLMRMKIMWGMKMFLHVSVV